MRSIFFLIALLLCTLSVSIHAQGQSLRLASTSWCPYICDNDEAPGFIVDTLTQLLAEDNINLDVDVLPWSRAIALARQGQYDGLLTAVESEAPDFHLTKVPSGRYQMCLYSKKESDLIYKDRTSLQDLTLGGINDYGYGEPLDSVISSPREGEKTYLISNTHPLEQLFRMVNYDRIDLFAEDSMVINHFIKSHPELDIVRKAGCLEEVPFYTAISPYHPQHEKWINRLDRLLATQRAQELYRQAQRQYQPKTIK